VLLIDERKGRNIAERFNLRFIGTIGVLLEAKDKNAIPTVKPILDALIQKAGFWVTEELYQHV